ncbi:MAG: PAS domain-containing sensor histidine kinase [Leptospiraceae bacterium]|nr:PAS domain-containing sensor histidine kinase [Leptospiraceae bacterium]
MKKILIQKISELLSLGIREGQSTFETRQIKTMNRISFYLGCINLFLLVFNIIAQRYVPLFLNLAILLFISTPIFLLNFKFKYKVAQVYSFFASNSLILAYAYYGISINRIVNFEVLIIGCGFFGAFIFDSLWGFAALFYSIISFFLIGAMKVYVGNIQPDSIFIGNIINSISTTLFLFIMVVVYKRDFKKSELALSKSEDRLQLVLKGSNNGWWDWDLVRETIYYSPLWWNTIGYEYNELAPKVAFWWAILHPDDQEHVNELYNRAMTTDLSSYEVEFRLMHKAGYYVPILSKGFISRDKEGKAIRISGSNIDLTEQKATEAKLQSLVKNITEQNEILSKQKFEIQIQSEKLLELNQVKDKLFSTIAHDIRGPFTSLILTLNSLKDEMLTEEDLKEMLPDITKNANNILGLIDSLFDWARTQLDGERVHPITFNSKKLIDDEISLLEFRAKEKGITLQSEVHENVFAYADKNMIELIIRNLISNALKFCSQGDKIIVSSIQKKNLIEISVADSGKGIAREHLEKIFTGSMISTLGTSGEKGTGLGLILSKEFVKKNGGTISVESQEGKGSRFYFTIPIAKN